MYLIPIEYSTVQWTTEMKGRLNRLSLQQHVAASKNTVRLFCSKNIMNHPNIDILIQIPK